VAGPSASIAAVGGVAPVVSTDSSAVTRQVAESLATGRDAHRLSPMLPAPAFDLDAYLRDPEVYLTESVPGRALQAAQPGDGVPVLRFAQIPASDARQGQPVALAVAAPVGAPVSFTAFDLGLFPNGLQAISVQAGPDGIARTEILAPPGSTGRMSLAVASPLCVQRLTHTLWISLP
jgi:hypothetical protein